MTLVADMTAIEWLTRHWQDVEPIEWEGNSLQLTDCDSRWVTRADSADGYVSDLEALAIVERVQRMRLEVAGFRLMIRTPSLTLSPLHPAGRYSIMLTPRGALEATEDIIGETFVEAVQDACKAVNG